MKRIFSLLACLVLLLLTSAAGALNDGEFEYELAQTETSILTRWLGTAAELEIPDLLGGKPVTQIGEGAFRDCRFLVNAKIPDGVEMLWPQAFYNCAALEEVKLPSSLKEIGDLAFAYCSTLETLKIPEGTLGIGEFAFGECLSLTSLTVPASVIRIGSDAFLGTRKGFTLMGLEGSYAQEYALANGIDFTAAIADAFIRTTMPETEAILEGSSTEQPQPHADDLPPEAAQGPVFTAEITVRFPHADRTGTYTGEMRDGLAHGKGSFTSVNADGISWTYEGAWENGAMNGLGILTWSDGVSYEGYYKDNQPYDGKWVVDGAVIYKGGFRMCPECGLSVFHGMGELTNRLGRTIYKGEFDNGLLKESSEERQARAQALDSQCAVLSEEEYSALMNIPGAGSGKLFRLEGRVGEILIDDEHGEGEFILLNNGSAAAPIHISYRYGTGEERAQAGRTAAVWGTMTGLYRDTDSRSRTRVMLRMDADVIQLGNEQPRGSLNEAVITAVKALDGRPLKNREFSFALDETFTFMEERISPLDGTITFVPVTFTSRLQTKANDREGRIAFDPIRYTADDIGGVFTYTVTEVPGVEAGMAYDPMIMTVTAIVTDNGGGQPMVSVFYPDDATFDNRVQAAEVPLNLEVSVELDGRPLQEAEFSFQLLENGEVLSVTSNGKDGRVVFDPVMFTAEDIGAVRRFIVRQIPADQPGVTFDLMEVPFDVSAELDPGGMGAPMLTVPVPEDTRFNNVFSAQAEANITFEVKLEGRAMKNGEFSFELSEGGSVLQRKRNNMDGGISFEPIVYTQADAGRTFSYAVRQVTGTEQGMEYDTSLKSADVTVNLEGGLLKTRIVYPAGMNFANRFTQQVAAPVLSEVEIDKAVITTGETVTFTPRISGGVKPYSFHYVLYRDGKEIKDIGWLAEAMRQSRLGTAGVVRMQVQVKDAEGRLSETVMSPEVIVQEQIWTPAHLEGTWGTTLTWSSYKADTPPKQALPVSYSVNMKLEMSSDGTGTMRVAWEGFTESNLGSVTYQDGIFKATISNGYSTDYYEGTLQRQDGRMIISGSLYETQPDIEYFGSFTAEKQE